MNPDALGDLEFMEATRKSILSDPMRFPYALLWPQSPDDIPDDSSHLRIVYLGPEWLELSPTDAQNQMASWHRLFGQTRRQFRNALLFARPDETAWSMRAQPELLYPTFEAPTVAGDYHGDVSFEEVPRSRLNEIVRREISPEELADQLGLGRNDASGIYRGLIPLSDAARWFFCFVGFPRFRDVEPIRAAIIQGIESGYFGLIETDKLLALDHPLDELHPQMMTKRKLDSSRVEFKNGHYLILTGAKP